MSSLIWIYTIFSHMPIQKSSVNMEISDFSFLTYSTYTSLLSLKVGLQGQYKVRIVIPGLIFDLNLYLAVHNCKQCRSRSDGFCLQIRIYTVCHSVCECEQKHYMM